MSVNIDKILPITSSVVDTSSSGIDLVGTLLSKNPLIPFNATQKILSFTSIDLVSAFFGSTSDEYKFATNYFNSWDGSPSKPKFLNIARYVDYAIAPYTRGGALTFDKLATLIAITSGTLVLKFNGVTTTINTINLSTATSFSSVASLLQTAIRASAIGALATVTYSSLTQSFTISNGDIGGTATVDYVIDGSGIGLGSLLLLTQNKGAVLSQGLLGLTPTQNMDGILAVTRNWVSYTQVWDVSQEVGYAEAIELAKWANDKQNRYAYFLWSSETNLTIPGNTSHIVTTINQYAYSSIAYVYNSYNHAGFFMGIGASVDYNGLNTTISFASKQQSGLLTSCNTDSEFDALIANGVNFYVDFSSANDHFRFSENGKITGIFKWMDNFYNQVWLADQVQLAEAVLLRSVPKVDYGTTGQALLKASLTTVMQKALLNGTSQTGNIFDDAQRAILKNQAGIDIADILTSSGYYIKLTPPQSSQRANRPAMGTQIWYTNNGSFYSINNNLTFVN